MSKGTIVLGTTGDTTKPITVCSKFVRLILLGQLTRFPLLRSANPRMR